MLRTVVEIALQSLPLSLAGLDNSRARAAQFFDPRSQLDVQARVLERDPGSGGDRSQELRLILQRRIVQQRRHASAITLDQPHRPTPVRIRHLHRPAIVICIASELGQPIRQDQRRIPSARASASRRSAGARIRPQLEEELADTRAGETVMKDPDQEDDRRHPEGHEGRPPDLCHARTAERVRGKKDGDHHQPERERVDEQSQRAAQRPARRPAPPSEDADSAETEGADRDELNMQHRQPPLELEATSNEVVRAEAAQRHPNDLEPDRGRVRRHDQGPLEPTSQPAARIRQENVQEQHGRQKVERLADRERDVAARPGKIGKEA